MPVPISIIILTKDEERNLPACLASVNWADDLLVVDSFSTDKTVEIAQQLGARVVQHPFANFASQHNFAQSQAIHEWVLFVDADERVSDELRDEIQALTQNGQINASNAYHIQRIHLFSGRWMPDPQKRRLNDAARVAIRQGEVPRLLKRTLANWQRPLHETVDVPEPHGVLDGVMYHYATSNLSLAFESFNYYTDLESAYLHRTRSRTRVTLLEAILRGIRAFLYPYLVWKWWKYGEQGLLLAIMTGYTKFINYAKLNERLRIEKNQGVWTERDRQLLVQFKMDKFDES